MCVCVLYAFSTTPTYSMNTYNLNLFRPEYMCVIRHFQFSLSNRINSSGTACQSRCDCIRINIDSRLVLRHDILHIFHMLWLLTGTARYFTRKSFHFDDQIQQRLQYHFQRILSESCLHNCCAVYCPDLVLTCKSIKFKFSKMLHIQ